MDSEILVNSCTTYAPPFTFAILLSCVRFKGLSICTKSLQRGDYLSGWQLDKQHEESLREAGQAVDDSDDEEDIPFACLICRKEFVDPVVTKCNHFFDSASVSLLFFPFSSSLSFAVLLTDV